MRNAAIWWCGCILAGWSSGGCAPSEEDLTTVRGEVTLHGRPLAGGMIVFTPDPEHGEDGPIATAQIDSEGHYCLSCELGEGAIGGWHRVSIANPTGSEVALPRRYRRPDLSGLCREVVVGNENVFNFELPGG